LAIYFLEKRLLDDALYENILLAKDIAKYCGELAGGCQYEDFYIVMLSIIWLAQLSTLDWCDNMFAMYIC